MIPVDHEAGSLNKHNRKYDDQILPSLRDSTGRGNETPR
jgi:hypothetical protein